MEEFKMVPLESCYESELNTRRHFEEKALADLTGSVRAKGVLVPLLVRFKPRHGRKTGAAADPTFEVLAGARRLRAAKAADRETLPVRIVQANDEEALEIVVLENLQREDVHALEEAEGYRALLRTTGNDVAALAAKVNKSESYIYLRLKLLDLIPAAQKAFLTDEITAGHAVLIARLQPKDQAEALKACFDAEWSGGKQHWVLCGVRALALWIESHIHLDLGKVPFDPGAADLVPKAGPCTTCPKRTGFSPALFPDIKHKDTCTDRACFHSKLAAFVERKKLELKEKGEKLVELSTEYSTKKGSAAIGRSQYNAAPASGKNTCDSVVKGIMVDGRELGKVLTVCTNANCKKHRYGYSGGRGASTQPTAAERMRRQIEKLDQRREAEKRRRFFAALHAGAPAKLEHGDLLRVFASTLLEMNYEVRKTLADVLGIEGEKREYGGPHVDGPLLAWARNRTTAELARAVAILPLARALHGWGYGGFVDEGDDADRGPEGCGFERAAFDWRVDLKAVENTVDAEFAEKEQRIRNRAAKAKKAEKATKKAAGKSAAKKGGAKKTKAAGKVKSEPKTKAKPKGKATAARV